MHLRLLFSASSGRQKNIKQLPGSARRSSATYNWDRSVCAGDGVTILPSEDKDICNLLGYN